MYRCRVHNKIHFHSLLLSLEIGFLTNWYEFWQSFSVCFILSLFYLSANSFICFHPLWVSWYFLLLMGCSFLLLSCLVTLDRMSDIVNLTFLVAGCLHSYKYSWGLFWDRVKSDGGSLIHFTFAFKLHCWYQSSI